MWQASSRDCHCRGVGTFKKSSEPTRRGGFPGRGPITGMVNGGCADLASSLSTLLLLLPPGAVWSSWLLPEELSST
jgi:hypothetical protein